MTPHLILADCFGNRTACPATRDNAMRLFAAIETDIPADIRTLAQRYQDSTDHPTWFFTTDTLGRLITQIVGAKEGDVLKAASSLRQLAEHFGEADGEKRLVRLTKAWQDEVMAWLMTHRVGIQWAGDTPWLDTSVLPKLDPIGTLSFMACYRDRDIVYADNADLELAKAFQRIKHNRFKEDAPEHRVVAAILDFVNDWTHRDVHYDLITLQDTL